MNPGKKEQQPVYQEIFEYLEKHYRMVRLDSPLSEFYIRDIYSKQYFDMDGSVNPDQRDFENPQKAAELLRTFARKAGADLIGFTGLKEHFVFEGETVSEPHCVVLGVEMNYDIIRQSPELISGQEALRAYWLLGAVANKLAEFIRFLGYPARAHHPRVDTRYPPTILHPLAAFEAGLGEFGRLGLLVTPEFGPRVRFSTITTELPLPQAERMSFGVEEFCQNCTLCRETCRGDAIPDEKAEVQGVLKYTIDPYKCLPYFAELDGCGLCFARCAFNKRPEELKRFVERLRKG